MNKFFGFLVLFCAFAIGVSTMPGCKNKDKDKDKDKTAEKDKDKDKTPKDKDKDGKEKDGKEKMAKSSLTVEEIGKVTIKQGDSADVKIMVKRVNMGDALKLKFEGLPDKVTAEDTEIAKDKDSATVKLTAAADAKVSTDNEVTVTAWSGDTKASQKFKLTVEKK